MNVYSPMPRGSGAIVVHRMLEDRLPDYKVFGYNPYFELMPPLLKWAVPHAEPELNHTTPDHAIFFRRADVPLVVTFHNLVIDRFMQAYSSRLQWLHYSTDLRWSLRRSLRAATLITAVSRFTADLATRGY